MIGIFKAGKSMAQLAIKGHTTRGKEVIALLEMLGGRNIHNYSADSDSFCFYIGKSTNIIYYDWEYKCCKDESMRVFSLEEFLEKYPYKVGDRVIIKVNNQEAIIDKAVWCCDTIIYCLKYDDCLEGNWRTEHLRPYKEETMKEKIQSYEVTEEICANEIAIEFNPSKFEMIERNGKYFIVKKQPHYPKTYEECWKILDAGEEEVVFDGATASEEVLLDSFIKLKRCRDAYWKIAGYWKPNLGEDFIYAIGTCYGAVEKRMVTGGSGILLFPTEEMRDTFYENFKDLIEQCKELL